METILEKEQMNSVRALADTNMQISEAKSILLKLQEEETDYLVSREKKAVERIEKVVKESGELAKQIKENYQGLKDMLVIATDFTGSMNEIYRDVCKAVDDFQERSRLWDEYADAQEVSFTEIRKKIKEDQEKIASDTEAIKEKSDFLDGYKRKLDVHRDILERGLKRLKENK